MDLEAIDQEKDNLSLYVRGFEDLERLAEASAKSRLSDKVEGEDVGHAIRIHKAMLESLHFNTPSGQQQQLMEPEFDQLEIFKDCIKEVSIGHKFELEDLLTKMCIKHKLWKTRKMATAYFEKNRHVINIGRANEGGFTYNE